MAVSYSLGLLAKNIKAFENIDWATLGKAAATLGVLVGIFVALSALGAAFPPLLLAMAAVAGLFVVFALAISLVSLSLA